MASREFNNEVSDLLIQECVGSRLIRPWSFLRLPERNTVKGSARSDGREEEGESLLFVFLLPITPRAPFRHPSRIPSFCAIQIRATGSKSGY